MSEKIRERFNWHLPLYGLLGAIVALLGIVLGIALLVTFR
jgi:hypothetical protein